MKNKNTILIADLDFQKHLTGAGHPESPSRYTHLFQALDKLHLKTHLSREASIREISLCHTTDYIDTVKTDIQKCTTSGIVDGSYPLSTGDVQICPLSHHVALKAAGAVLTAVDAVMQKKASNAFCLVRPPGHHACSDKGMGFCLFNNIAIGARYAQTTYGIKKVLIVDWDVHHGNGTQEIFYSDPTVFYFSTHQFPLYPGTGTAEETGTGLGKGTTLNCPIMAGRFSKNEIFHAFQEKLIPKMEEFQPDLVMISAGFDAHIKDPLGGFNLEDEDFGKLTEIVKVIADKFAKGRIISALEGGYNLDALASAGTAHIRSLMNPH